MFWLKHGTLFDYTGSAMKNTEFKFRLKLVAEIRSFV